MRLVRALVRGLRAGRQPLDAEVWRYLSRVHRLGEGDGFVAFDGEGHEARCTLLTEGGRGYAEAAPLAASPRRRELVWLQALGKGDKTDAVVRDATELSATRVVLVTTERTVPRLGDKADRRLARWRAIAEEAARQSGRADVPEVSGPVPLDEALRANALELSVILHPGAATPLRDLLDDARGDDGEARRASEGAPPRSLALAAGPEGGFSDAEIALARSLSFEPATLGPVVLRTETAAAAVLGALLVLGP